MKTCIPSQPSTIQRLYRAIRKKVLTFVWMRKNVSPVASDYGVLLTPNWADATFRYCVFASYGTFYSEYLQSLTGTFDFLDIGANQGIYSLIAAKNPSCRSVHAFEPVPKLAGLIEVNAALNGVHKVRVHMAAVSNQSGCRIAILDPRHTGGTQISTRESVEHLSDRGDRTVEKHEVTCVSTSYIESLLESSPPAVHVKIDVEGHEKHVFDALLACEHFCKIKSIFYEVDLKWMNPDSIATNLSARGFNRFTKIGEGTHHDMLATKDP